MYIAKVVRCGDVPLPVERCLRKLISQRFAAPRAAREPARRAPALAGLSCLVWLATGCSVYKAHRELERRQKAAPATAAHASWMPESLDAAADASTRDASIADASATAPAASITPTVPPVTATKQTPPVGQASADLDAGPDQPDPATRIDASQPDAAMPASDASATDAGKAQPTDPTGSAARSCTRESLQEHATQYLDALASGDEHSLDRHPNLRYTENGKLETLGFGLWLNHPKAEFARHVLDDSSCSIATEAVLRESAGRVVLGLRLRYLDNQLLEVEAQVVRANDAYWAPDQIVVSGPDPWLEPLPKQQRSSAAELTLVAMNYFASAVDESLLPPHADNCKRRQNGALMPNKGVCGRPGTQRFQQQRFPLVDEATGIATAVIKYNDFIGMYLLKVSAGSIQNIEVLGGASSATTGW